MGLELSIVIPTYNAAESLARTLQSLCERWAELGNSAAEVIIVNDGSADHTEDVIKHFHGSHLRLRALTLPRGPSSGRARARNAGMRTATGRTLLLLDSGVVLGKGLLLAASQTAETVSIYKTLGLFTPANRAAAHPDSARLGPEWADVREPYFDARGVPAPWLLAWTCALSVPRVPALAIGGFDEEFLGWGAEDVDFARRLALAGMRFVWRADVCALHTPQTRPVKQLAEHARNARMMHVKSRTRESELFSVLCDGFAVNLLIARLDRLQLAALSPPHPLPPSQPWYPDPARSIGVGLRWADVLALRPAVALVHEQSLISRLEASWPSTVVHCLLGVATLRAPVEFDCAVVGDLLRLLPLSLQQALLKEMRRVAKRVVVVASTPVGHESAARTWAGWGFSSVEEIIAQGRDVGLTVTQTHRAGALAVAIDFS